MKSVFKAATLILIFLLSVNCFSQEEEGKSVPFAVLEEIPMFPNCNDIPKSEEKNCFMQEMNNHIKLNFKYPKRAVRNNIQGRVTVRFLINHEGYVVISKTIASEGCELLSEEAERIINLLPRFKPGMQKGNPVGVFYAQPIVFKL
ncbi:energy transducer TonB [uncultured Flavobacterium sp.]|uniref:energy transducer TonB n=1 Tax=uncultured Flavobacterium sp. TaxID=165435 RepID=UPI0030EBB827|tara:strand:+ start:214758 stop:215195 length:438 start_codon:yes stop_codon:yes gene_type:complete